MHYSSIYRKEKPRLLKSFLKNYFLVLATFILIPLSTGSYYLEIYATPTTTSYLGSYKFYLNSSSTTDLGEDTILTKKILKVTDLLGRESKGTKNELLFYIYDDGSVEKRIIIE